MYRVWPDSESHKSAYKDFSFIDDACAFAQAFVHQYDNASYRVILHIDNEDGETIDTYENINPCDVNYKAH